MNKKQQKSGLLVLGKPEAFGKCELEGFVARSGGAKRESNPYDSKRNWTTDAANAHPGAVTAWRCGWDTASMQLT